MGGPKHVPATYLLLLGWGGLVSAATLTVAPGDWPDEISWGIECDDGTTASGGGHVGTISFNPAVGAACDLEMVDSYGDGWNGAEVQVMGMTFTLSSGDFESVSFVIPISPPPPVPPPLGSFASM